MAAQLANARVEYVDDASGRVVAIDEFYDPGLDPESVYSKTPKRPFVPHLAYGCGKPKKVDKHTDRESFLTKWERIN